MSQEIFDYKSEDESVESDHIMSPVPNYNQELVHGQTEAQSGDALYSAVEIKSKKDIIPGAIGCFIPVGRPGINERFLDLEAKSSAQGQEILKLKSNAVKSKSKIKKLESANEKMQARTFFNSIVQLVYSLVFAKISDISPSVARDRNGNKIVKFSIVLGNASVNPEIKSQIKQDYTYNSLTEIMNQKFWGIVKNRNADAHPGFIDLEEIESLCTGIGKGSHLTKHQLELYKTSKDVFDKIKKIKELEKLIKIFNDSD